MFSRRFLFRTEFPVTTTFWTIAVTSAVCLVLSMAPGVQGASYNETLDLIHDKLESSTYSTELRPVIDQSQHVVTSVSFSLIGILEVDDVTQRFTISGYFTFCWTDELLTWDPGNYGGVDHFHVHPSTIWIPRMVLLNTMDEADPFGEDRSSTKVNSDGSVVWNPGGIFLTTCQLDLEKFPFDTQSCYVMMCTMYYHVNELRLTSQGPPEERNKHVLGQNKGWTLEAMEMEITERALDNSSDERSCLYISIRVKRRPKFSVITILLPLVFLSLLNTAVFVIPIDSQERITFAITVLLAISVMMGTVSTFVPQASDIMPALTNYLLILLIGACVTVLSTIGIEALHHHHHHHHKEHDGDDDDDDEESNQAHNHVKSVNIVSPSPTTHQCCPDITHGNGGPGRTSPETKLRNSTVWQERCRMACQMTPGRVNKACFVITCIFWCVTTMWYFCVTMQ